LSLKTLEKRVPILTGSPGAGKTTVLEKALSILKERGISSGGMISRESRENGIRVGFQISDISSGRQGWLAHVNQKTGPQVGKYRVNLTDLPSVGAQAIADAVENADIVAIDEIGPMELFSEKFKMASRKALDSDKFVIAVVHFGTLDRLVVQAKGRVDAEVVVVTGENRVCLPEALAEKAATFLKRE
jgi:nucleoside-triphosphatase